MREKIKTKARLIGYFAAALFIFSASILYLGNSRVSAAIAFVQNAGTNTEKFTEATAGLDVTITSGAAVGDTIIVVTSSDWSCYTYALKFGGNASTSAGSPGSVSDSAGNSYNQDLLLSNGNIPSSSACTGSSGSNWLAIYSSKLTTAISPGGTISIVYDNGAASPGSTLSNVRTASVMEFSGVNSFDVGASSFGNSTTADSTATATTSTASELIIGGVGVTGPSGDTFTATSPFTAGTRAGTTGQGATSNRTVNPMYKTVSSTGTYNASATLGTGRDWTAGVVTYSATSANSSPAAPTLSVPTSGATGVSTTPSFSLKTTDANSDYVRYKIILYSSDCISNPQTFNEVSSQAGWSGQDQQTSTAYTTSTTLAGSTTATYAYSGTPLSMNTTYCWKAAAIDPAGSNFFGSYSSNLLFTTTAGNAPSAPTLYRPISGETNTSTNPIFQLRSSDVESDVLEYKIVIYDSNCTTNPQIFDQTLSQTGWTGQDQQNAYAYTGSSSLSGSTVASYGQVNLSPNTQYCWKAAAIDPAGTNTFGSFSGTQLFTTGPTNTGVVNINGGTNISGGSYIR